MLESLLERIESVLDLKIIEMIPRFIEIFDELLMQMKNSSNLTSFTSRFCLFCSKYLQNSSLEVKLSIFNYYTDVLCYDRNSFFSNQYEILNTSNLFAQTTFLDSEVEAEGKLI